jgi:hypothetical protein
MVETVLASLTAEVDAASLRTQRDNPPAMTTTTSRHTRLYREYESTQAEVAKGSRPLAFR